MTLDLSYEREFGDIRVAGIDEVGRGPWAGPVTAAAVIFPGNCPDGLRDSKKLSEARREALFDKISELGEIGIGWASVEEIDTINILQASHLAMRRAVDALQNPPGYVLVDGNRMPPGFPCRGHTLVKGDSRIASIAAASIIAKVSRDRLMRKLAEEHPQYGWDTNKGYGTKAHRVSLLGHGPTPHHRRSFKPLHNM